MNTKPVSVLLDNGIVSAAELVEFATKEVETLWGNIQSKTEIVGYRKKVAKDASQQKQIDAIVTVGRLIREGVVIAHTYSELEVELSRRSAPISAFHALEDCHISTCPAPIERSRFRQTVNLDEYLTKGGKKDKKRNNDLGDFNQIPFMQWLLSLDRSAVQSILNHGQIIGLTEFELESFRRLDWFKFICSRFGFPENYPDAFHLWTAERNGIDVLLTLDTKLPKLVRQISQSHNHIHKVKTSALMPIEFLQSLNISALDDVPIKEGKFYDFT